MTNLLDLDVEDITKAKKAAYTLSISIILITALELRSDEINLFGLVIGINKVKIILILKAALVAVSFFIFSKILLNAFVRSGGVSIDRIKAESAEDRKKSNEHNGGKHTSIFPNSPNSKTDDADYINTSQKREARMRSIEANMIILKFSVNEALPYAFLSVLIFAALFQSERVSEIISHYTMPNLPEDI